jgi:predicted Fe-Mo cluster-binding NifX family protein
MARELLSGISGGSDAVKLALSVWNGRISPLFDSTQRALVVEVEANKVVDRTEEAFSSPVPREKIGRLVSLGVSVLICGAVSRAVAAMVQTAGIRLAPWTAGDVQDVLDAFLEGRLDQDRFLMPGCRRRSRGMAGRCHRGRRVHGQRR